MTDEADGILRELLKLPADERARVAAELLASLDGAPDLGAAEAWAAEIDRRVRQVQAEGPKGQDWRDVHARIAARLRSK